MKSFQITVFGQGYKVSICSMEEEPGLENCSGFTDHSVHEIGILDKRPAIGRPDSMKDQYAFMKAILRHEIMHAALFECGITEEQRLDHERLADWYEIKAHALHAIVVDAESKFDQVMHNIMVTSGAQ